MMTVAFGTSFSFLISSSNSSVAVPCVISTLSSSIETFRLDTGRFPTTEEGLQALRVPPGDVQTWKGPYLSKDVVDDPWNNPYIYEYPGPDGEDSFILMSLGSDGQEGGEGNAADIRNDE